MAKPGNNTDFFTKIIGEFKIQSQNKDFNMDKFVKAQLEAKFTKNNEIMTPQVDKYLEVYKFAEYVIDLHFVQRIYDKDIILKNYKIRPSSNLTEDDKKMIFDYTSAISGKLFDLNDNHKGRAVQSLRNNNTDVLKAVLALSVTIAFAIFTAYTFKTGKSNPVKFASVCGTFVSSALTLNFSKQAHTFNIERKKAIKIKQESTLELAYGMEKFYLENLNTVLPEVIKDFIIKDDKGNSYNVISKITEDLSANKVYVAFNAITEATTNDELAKVILANFHDAIILFNRVKTLSGNKSYNNHTPEGYSYNHCQMRCSQLLSIILDLETVKGKTSYYQGLAA